MSTCLKTGLDVFLIEYNAKVRADVHDANGSIVINYEPKSWAHADPAEGTEPHAAACGRRSISASRSSVG